MKIKKASRQGAKLVIGMVGPSGGGKTYSALVLAKGMAKMDMSKVCVIDTENRRAELYADDPVVGGFNVIQLDAPFSPMRYTEAVEAAENAGMEVIVIDSISHEWNNSGGVLDMAESSKVRNEFAKWNTPKKKHNAFFNSLLQSKCHIIPCFRAKEKYKQVMNPETGKQEVVSIGMQPIQNSDMIFDMTLSFMMENKRAGHIKIPDQLKKIFPENCMISADMGHALALWVEGGEPVNHHLEKLKADGREAAGRGFDSLRVWFTALSKEDKALINQYKDEELKSIANSAQDFSETISGKGEDESYNEVFTE